MGARRACTGRRDGWTSTATGPLREELQRLDRRAGGRGSVTLHGLTGDRDGVFDRAALFVSLGRIRGAGAVDRRGARPGLPVVAFDARYGPREAIGDAGVLVAPGDVEGLADAVIGLLRD